ncbi:GTP-binding protein [Candidatus Micrarchaeota archaeon]|nr:GTP-binding protein [Candidatus Micrarchaeota archaeon]
MGISEKIAEIEAEMEKTQKHKGTEHHLGMLKAKLAKLREQAESGSGRKGPSKGFDVKKSGNATIVFIGLPSVGKSTMLNALTGAGSKTAAYAFTTLTVVPGILHYKGAQLQLLDLPGIIRGASKGVGRGKEVLAVARNSDLILLVVDVKDPGYVNKLIDELGEIGIRVDQKPPNIVIERTESGGIEVNYSVKPTHLNDKLVASVLGEYGIFSAIVNIREDATVERLIDALLGNRRFIPSLRVLNKIDLAKKEDLKKLDKDFVKISAEKNIGIEELKQAIYDKLGLIRIFTRSKFEKADMDAPLMMRRNATVADLCDLVHRELKKEFKFAEVWGKSAKHPGQKVGLHHKLQDGDVVYIHKK